MRKNIVLGGFLIVFLLLWSQFEGYLSEWIYKRTGVMDTKVQVERAVEKQMDERLKRQQEEYQKQNADLRLQILELQNQIKNRAQAKGTSPGGPNN